MANYLPHFAEAWRRHQLVADQNVLLNTITNSHNSNFTNIVLASYQIEDPVLLRARFPQTKLLTKIGFFVTQKGPRSRHCLFKLRNRADDSELDFQLSDAKNGQELTEKLRFHVARFFSGRAYYATMAVKLLTLAKGIFPLQGPATLVSATCRSVHFTNFIILR